MQAALISLGVFALVCALVTVAYNIGVREGKQSHPQKILREGYQPAPSMGLPNPTPTMQPPTMVHTAMDRSPWVVMTPCDCPPCQHRRKQVARAMGYQI